MVFLFKDNSGQILVEFIIFNQKNMRGGRGADRPLIDFLRGDLPGWHGKQKQ